MPMLQLHHRQICKYPHLEFQGMRTVLDQLRDPMDAQGTSLVSAVSRLQVVRSLGGLVLRRSTDKFRNDSLLRAASD